MAHSIIVEAQSPDTLKSALSSSAVSHEQCVKGGAGGNFLMSNDFWKGLGVLFYPPNTSETIGK